SKMTGCSVPDCNNSTKKGYIIKVFPRNPEKRAKWASNIGRLKFNAMTISGFCRKMSAPIKIGNVILRL
ncbi:hypothetical protein ALC62_04508, partial [Cyphomyrmex costatus]